MSATILQTVLARCREDFAMASATPAIVPGTARVLSVTAGSYVDLVGEVSGALDTALKAATLRIFVAGSAVGEGASVNATTIADTVSLTTRARYGPITAAQALTGIAVDLRVGATQ